MYTFIKISIYQPMAISPCIFLTYWIDIISRSLFFVDDDSSTSEQFAIKIDLENIFTYTLLVIFYFSFTSLTRIIVLL